MKKDTTNWAEKCKKCGHEYVAFGYATGCPECINKEFRNGLSSGTLSVKFNMPIGRVEKIIRERAI